MAMTRRGKIGARRANIGVLIATYALALCVSCRVEAFSLSTWSSSLSRGRSPPSKYAPQPSLVEPLHLLPFREAEVTEQLVGGVRYSMVPIPKDMLKTTLFVTNLDDFVYDDDLSAVFGGMPACVVRKPDMTSLGYGFVAFRSSEDAQVRTANDIGALLDSTSFFRISGMLPCTCVFAYSCLLLGVQAALIRTRGQEWRGRELDVQEVRRDLVVRVPERLVAFVKGVKAVRRILQEERQSSSSTAPPVKKPKVKAAKSWSPPKSSTPSSSSNRKLYRHLKPEQQAELDRALLKGFLVLDAPKHNPRLVDIHRRCCDARGVPQVMVVKGRGSGRWALDRVLVDLSPLRLQAVFDDPDSFLVRRKIDIFSAATATGMELLRGDQEACELDCAREAAESETEVGADLVVGGSNDDDNHWTCAYAVTIDTGKNNNAYASKPISKLPPLSVGIFVGDRPQAKAMAKELSDVWELPDPAVQEQRDEERTRRQQVQGKAPRRNRGGGNHQEFFW